MPPQYSSLVKRPPEAFVYRVCCPSPLFPLVQYCCYQRKETSSNESSVCSAMRGFFLGAIPETVRTQEGVGCGIRVKNLSPKRNLLYREERMLYSKACSPSSIPNKPCLAVQEHIGSNLDLKRGICSCRCSQNVGFGFILSCAAGVWRINDNGNENTRLRAMRFVISSGYPTEVLSRDAEEPACQTHPSLFWVSSNLCLGSTAQVMSESICRYFR
ncbi:hypothetical protein AV530_010250 [Patagioenas fasciata monilis]|uniref:Uncharacterized protein n=1 Tax=Patagioenas fasciata monilis TaxID=372326 RepID=A0A1V4KCR8_PATFA|nr:hypothetical protein AV530_010250 [Patagioenas fasciata monilis]